MPARRPSGQLERSVQSIERGLVPAVAAGGDERVVVAS